MSDTSSAQKAGQHAARLLDEVGSSYTVQLLNHGDNARGVYRVSNGTITVEITPKEHDNYVDEAIREDDFPPAGFVKVLDHRFKLEADAFAEKMAAPVRDADTVLTEEIQAAAKALNSKVKEAVNSGLKVEFDVLEHATMRGYTPIAEIKIYRKIKTPK